MSTTATVIPKDLAPLVEQFTDELGFASEEEFVIEAIRDKVLELRKKMFFAGTDKIRKKLEQRGVSEKSLLQEFQRRHSA